MKLRNQQAEICGVRKKKRSIAGPGHFKKINIKSNIRYTIPPNPHPNPKRHSPKISFQSIVVFDGISKIRLIIGNFRILII